MTDKNMDSRRTAAVSTANGLPGRKQRPRDSTDEDRKMELKDALRSRDREQFRKKDRDRDFLKRRRVSEDDYFEEEDGTGTGTTQLPTGSFSLSNNRRGIDTQRSSPALREAVDEVIGVRIPRRARSASAKKLQEVLNSGSGDSKSTPSPDAGSPIGSGSASPRYSGSSMKKKMKCVGSRSRASNSKSSSLIQNEIEIEVAEALFDLMTQSHSQSKPSEMESSVCRDGISAVDELKGSKPESGKVGVQNEESVKGVEKEKSGDDPAQESVRGDGFVDEGKVGSLKEMESTSRVKRNACGIQDTTVTKADYAAVAVESDNKKEARVVIDLMELPSLPSSLERDTLPDIDPNVMARDAQKKSEVTPRIGVISDYQLPILNSEKKRRHDGITSASDSTSQQPQGWKAPASLSSFPIGMGSWPCILPHPGYSPPLGTRPSMTMQPPQFKFVKPRTKRCTTHLLIADSIRHHNQLVTKSLSSSGPTNGGSVATFYGTKPLSLKSMIPTQKLTPGKDKTSDAAAASAADFTTVGKSMFLQNVSNQAPTHNLLQNSGFTLGLGHHQPTIIAPANPSGGPNSSRKIPPNSSLPEAQFFNPFFPSNEAAAASYMAMLQSGGRSIPIPTNISLPSFKNGPSFYSPPMFNMGPPSQKSDNKPEKNIPQHFPLPFGSNSGIFQMPPELSWNKASSEGKSQTDSKSENPLVASFYHHQHQMQMQQMMLKGVSSSAAAAAAASQPDYFSFLPKWDNFPRPTTAVQEGGSSRVKSLQVQTPSSSAQVAINNQRNNGSAVQETEGSSPACRGGVPSILSSCTSQLPEVKYG